MINTLIGLFSLITMLALTGIMVLLFGWFIVFTVSFVIDKVKEIKEKKLL